MPEIIYGKPIANKILSGLQEEFNVIRKSLPQPVFVAITNKLSLECQTYLRMQKRVCEKFRVQFDTIFIDRTITQKEILKRISNLNSNQNINCISIHLPVLEHLCAEELLQAVSIQKDVEGLHPYHIGMLAYHDHYPSPCAARAVFEILQYINIDLKGKEVVVISHSALIGKPLSYMLLQSKDSSPTVTICHIATRELNMHTKNADIIISAAGKPGLIKQEMIKEGAIIIDASIVQTKDGRFVGDIDFDGVKDLCSYITPVPGGVSPVTLAILAKNIVAVLKSQI